MDALSPDFPCAAWREPPPKAAWELRPQPQGPPDACCRRPPRCRTDPACRPAFSAPGPRGSVFRPACAESRAWDSAAIGRRGESMSRGRPPDASFASFLLPHHVLKILLVFANVFDQLDVGNVDEGHVGAPGLGVRRGVVDDELQIDVPEV